MYQFTGFSEKANLALNNAVNCAEDMGHTYIGSEHVLAGLLKDPTNVASVVLRSRRITYNGLYEKIRGSVGIGMPTELTVDDMTPRCRRIIENAIGLAASSHHMLTGTEHLLMAVLRDNKCIGSRLLSSMGVSASSMCAEITGALPFSDHFSAEQSPRRENDPRKNDHPTLTKYGTDLTAEAREGRIDPVCGRDSEIDRVIRILCRRTKNNPCLLGEPGVGKTAVVEGLALKIASGNVPELLRGTELRTLELTGMVAGAKYRGDFEERIRNAVREVRAAGNIVLFIDEIHNLIGAGSAEGAVDAANILKPVLARGEIRIIGATTPEEYRKNIEKDAALERRFQTVAVREPSPEGALEILQDLRPRYEEHHRVKITDAALSAAVSLSVRYLSDRFLPDKAIDLMDEAASGVSLKHSGYPPEIEELIRESERLNREKANAVNAQDFEKAVMIRDREKKINRSLSAAMSEHSQQEQILSEVTERDIAAALSERTGIPAAALETEDKRRLTSLEEEIRRHIIGQDNAVRTVVTAVKRGRSGVGDPARPVGSFLFCGPTGVGKTALAKELSRALFGNESSLIRLDMSEYSEKHTVSALVGAPPGYVGFEDGGQLVEKIRRRPYSVILFDEIEKAHPDIFNALLQILDEGMLTSSSGKKADCRNCIIIMTSNAGARLIGNEKLTFGFSEKSTEKDRKFIRSAVEGELKKIFRPEFLNRIDETVIFDRLTKEAIVTITENYLKTIAGRLANTGTVVEYAAGVAGFLAEKGYDEEYGARFLRRTVVAEVENPLAEAIIAGLSPSEKAVFCVEDGGLRLKICRNSARTDKEVF